MNGTLVLLTVFIVILFGCGIYFLRFPEVEWRRMQRYYERQGLYPERTPEWDARTSMTGFTCNVIGFVLLAIWLLVLLTR